MERIISKPQVTTKLTCRQPTRKKYCLLNDIMQNGPRADDVDTHAV